MQYFVRHKFGVSKEYNTFSQHPWHGSGQGAADAALRYIVLSDTLIDAYHSKIDMHLIYDPTHHIEILRSLKAFINDVVLHTHQPPDKSVEELQLCAQEKLTWWDQLVKVTGGELNPKNAMECYTRGPLTSMEFSNSTKQISRHPSYLSHSKMCSNLSRSSKTTKVPATWDYTLRLTIT